MDNCKPPKMRVKAFTWPSLIDHLCQPWLPEFQQPICNYDKAKKYDPSVLDCKANASVPGQLMQELKFVSTIICN